MKRRGCSTRTRQCRATRNPTLKTPNCCVHWNLRILGDVARLLDKFKVPWWADYGTLLGYMTGKQFYWNDKDTDVCLLADDRASVLGKIAPALRTLGLRARYRPPQSGFVWGDALQVRLSQSNGNNCDLTFWNRREDGMLDRTSYARGDVHKGRAMPESWVLPTTRGMFSGVEINLPAEPELLIAHRYGAGWRDLPPVYTDGVERHDYQPEPDLEHE